MTSPDSLRPGPSADTGEGHPRIRSPPWPALALLAFAIGLLTLGALWFVTEKTEATRAAEASLTLVAKLKARAIANWVAERRGDAAALALQLEASPDVRTWLKADGPVDARLTEMTRKLHSVDVYETYRDVTLYDARGRPLVSTAAAAPKLDGALAEAFARSVAAGGVRLAVDHGPSRRGDDDDIAFCAPVADGGAPSGRVIGVVVLRVVRSIELSPIVDGWPGASPGAETLVLDHRSMRAGGAGAGPMRVMDWAAAVNAPGVLDGPDDRGRTVIAAAAPIRDTPWVLFVERATSDVFAPLRQLAEILGAAMAALMLSGGLLLAAGWRREQAVLIARRTEAEAKRQVLARRFEFLTRHANDIILLLDSRGFIADANERAVEAYQWPRDILVGSAFAGIDPTPDSGQAGDPTGRLFESIHRRRGGAVFPVEISQRQVDIDGETWSQLIIRDITERRNAERRDQRATRALATLSAGNVALVRARTLDGLYQQMCDIIVQTGGFRMAWVGMAEQDAEKTVRPVAFAGHEAGYLSRIKVSWADSTHGRGPTGTAIREKAARHNTWSGDEPRFGPWRAQALEQGFHSSIALPLADDGGVFGALTIYAAERDAFGPAEVALLEELAGDLAFGVVTLRDRQMRDRLAAIVESSRDAIIGVSLDGVITSWNQGAVATYGYAPDEAVGRNFRLIMAEHEWPRGDRILEQAGIGALADPSEADTLRKDGRRITVSLTTSPTYDLAGQVSGVSAIARDITEQKHNEAALIRAARFDSLTGLANRASFADAVQAAVARAGSGGRKAALLLADLDNFKDVNDTLGHDAGDNLLKALSARLTDGLVGEGIVARLGGDEFAILLDETDPPSRIEAVAQGVLEAINAPLSLEGVELRIGASLGIAVVEGDGADAGTLLSRADLALNQAKDQGRGLFRHFTEAMDVAAQRRITLGRELHAAIDDGQLRLVYQPQADSLTGEIVGAEALARWSHPQRGVIGPAEFIPISESIGLAGAIGRWVMGEACRQIRLWLDMGLSPPPVAINLSATQFIVPGELERDLEAALTRHGVTPDRLELELTETVLMDSSAGHSDTLMRLRARGFSLSIDDFGTGYSSLDYLRRFPADRIKIDQNFVKDIESTPGAEAIVKAIIALAGQLHMGVIAEGVETSRHRDLLLQWECREMQGYFFSRPVSADQLTVFLAEDLRLPV